MRTLRSAVTLMVLISASPALAQSQGTDTRLTMKARQTLGQDAMLAILPELRVTVRNGVATLWGAVPDGETARRAEGLLRPLAGVSDVRNELHVQSPTDPMVAFLKQNEGESGRAYRLAARPPSLLTSRPEDEIAPPAAAGKGIALLPPLTLKAAPAAEPVRDPAAALARLLLTEPRFRGIQTDARDGIVWLRGNGARAEDVFELARIASTLPGVERVIVQDR